MLLSPVKVTERYRSTDPMSRSHSCPDEVWISMQCIGDRRDAYVRTRRCNVTFAMFGWAHQSSIDGYVRIDLDIADAIAKTLEKLLKENVRVYTTRNH